MESKQEILKYIEKRIDKCKDDHDNAIPKRQVVAWFESKIEELEALKYVIENGEENDK